MNKHLIDPYLERFQVTAKDENDKVILHEIIETVGGKKDAERQASKMIKQQSEYYLTVKKL